MDFSFSEKAERFRQEVRDFLAREWPQDEKAFRRKLAEKGWLGLSIPEKYGGQGRSIEEQYVFLEELAYAGVAYTEHFTSIGTDIVAPTLLRFGSEQQKQKFLPAIARGEVEFCLGYTEPNAGSDLASLETRAVREGDHYIISGTKMYTSVAEKADYCWLAARTDPDAPRHRGISLFIVDMKSPGIGIQPLWTMGDRRSNITFWDNVRVPRENLVGEENHGWEYITCALDFERLVLCHIAGIRAIFDRLLGYVKSAGHDKHLLRDNPIVRTKLAQLSVELEVGQLLTWRALSILMKGAVPHYEVSMQKVFTTELLQRLAHLGTQILGLYGQLKPECELAPLSGEFERLYRSAVMWTFGAGSSEIQRTIIALRGLGLPKG